VVMGLVGWSGVMGSMARIIAHQPRLKRDGAPVLAGGGSDAPGVSAGGLDNACQMTSVVVPLRLSRTSVAEPVGVPWVHAVPDGTVMRP